MTREREYRAMRDLGRIENFCINPGARMRGTVNWGEGSEHEGGCTTQRF